MATQLVYFGQGWEHIGISYDRESLLFVSDLGEQAGGGQGRSRFSHGFGRSTFHRPLGTGTPPTGRTESPRVAFTSHGQACRSRAAGEKARFCGPATKSRHRCDPDSFIKKTRFLEVRSDGEERPQIDDASFKAWVLRSPTRELITESARCQVYHSAHEADSHCSMAKVRRPHTKSSGLWRCPGFQVPNERLAVSP